MASGEINLQANDLRIATVTFEDGAVGNVGVVIPKEGGTLASEAYVASQIGAIPTISDASQTVKGIIEIATDAEVQAGTDTVRAITPAGMKAGLNASGVAPIYACRAWVNFNGTGTVAIRASGNVSSITDNGVGDYTVNFTTAMPDANYSSNVTSLQDVSSNANYASGISPTLPTVSGCRVVCSISNGSDYDSNIVNVSVFR